MLSRSYLLAGFISVSLFPCDLFAEEAAAQDPSVATISGITAALSLPKQTAAKQPIEAGIEFTMRINYTYVFAFDSIEFTFSNLSSGDTFTARPGVLPHREVDRVPFSESVMETIHALPDVVRYSTDTDKATGKKMVSVYRCMYLHPSTSHTFKAPLNRFQEQGEIGDVVSHLPPGTYNVNVKFTCVRRTGRAAEAISWWAGTGQMMTTMEVTK